MSPSSVDHALESVTIRTRRDMTLRWSFRKGDYLIWFRRGPTPYRNRLHNRNRNHDGNENGNVHVRDMWQLVDGSHAVITNRRQDFPIWFDLHPTEVSNSLISWMMKKISSGDHPSEPIDGPNIWRLNTGDRVVWVGVKRPFSPSAGDILAVIDCDEPVAILGEHPDGPLGFMETDQTPEGVALCRKAVEAERALGTPRSFAASENWTIG